jgi:hypothetical protein
LLSGGDGEVKALQTDLAFGAHVLGFVLELRLEEEIGVGLEASSTIPPLVPAVVSVDQ